MDTRAPREPSIVASFCPRPSQGSGAGSVAPIVCHLALGVGRAPRAVLGGDAQSDNKRATTQDGPATVGTAAPSPRCGVPALRRRAGPSDSPARW